MAQVTRRFFKEVRLQQFRSLVAVARWHTFSSAANALKLTRASVWQQVRGLEQQFSCALVRTRGKRVELTPAGLKLVEIVAPLVAGFDSVKSTLDESMSGEVPQTLAIASAPSFLIYELREPIFKVHARFPKLQLSLLERNSSAAIELLERGGADFALAAQPKHIPFKASLEYTPLATYPFTLICPPDHPLLAKRALTLADFTRFPLILPGHIAYCRQHFDSTMDKHGLLTKTNVVIESNFPIMLFEYVRMGLGVALTPLPPQPAPAPSWHHAGVVLRSVAPLFGVEPICFVRRRGQFETPYAALFRELLTGSQKQRSRNASRTKLIVP